MWDELLDQDEDDAGIGNGFDYEGRAARSYRFGGRHIANSEPECGCDRGVGRAAGTFRCIVGDKRAVVLIGNFEMNFHKDILCQADSNNHVPKA